MESQGNADTVIGVNVTLKGNLKNKGSILINGNIEGEVRSDENIDIGETAKLKGPVIARTIEVSGEIKGLVEATEQLQIHPTGRIVGDINAKSLIIQQGATFVGKSIMPDSGVKEADIKEIKEEIKEEKKKEETAAEKADKFGFFGKK